MSHPFEDSQKRGQNYPGKARKSNGEYPYEDWSDDEAGKVKQKGGMKCEIFQNTWRARAKYNVQNVHCRIDVHVEKGEQHDDRESDVVKSEIEAE